ncbi:MAG: DUF2279 domain-containing protein [Bacteroidia bacterium]
MSKILTYLLAYFILPFSSISQNSDSLTQSNFKQRKCIVIGGEILTGGGSLILLQQAWYKQHQTGSFHFFNDNSEWLQMDKVGHFWTASQLGRLSMEASAWAGMSKRQQLVMGTTGLIYLTGVEILDGFSNGWGFSYGDMLANVSGAGLALIQHSLWDEQKFIIKYSYTKSIYPYYNPNLLGSNLPERLLKDYNAQTYWLSFSPFNFSNKLKKMNWLCLSLGYSATGMVRAENISYTYHYEDSNVLYTVHPERYRQYYFSIDIDFSKLNFKKKWLKGIASTFNLIKLPFPAIGIDKRGVNFNWLK